MLDSAVTLAFFNLHSARWCQAGYAAPSSNGLNLESFFPVFLQLEDSGIWLSQWPKGNNERILKFSTVTVQGFTLKSVVLEQMDSWGHMWAEANRELCRLQCECLTRSVVPVGFVTGT